MANAIIEVKCRKTVWYYVLWLILKILALIKNKNLLTISTFGVKQPTVTVEEVLGSLYIDEQNNLQ